MVMMTMDRRLYRDFKVLLLVMEAAVLAPASLLWLPQGGSKGKNETHGDAFASIGYSFAPTLHFGFARIEGPV